ncbi:MAG: ATP-binding protein [Planctomycetota bacterium]
MAVSWASFERYKQRGLDARRAGQWESARTYLLEASRAMVELARQSDSDAIAAARRDTAAKLLELAKDCADAKESGRKAPGVDRGSGKQAASAEGEEDIDGDKFLVKEKPGITFADVAGLEDVKEDIRLKMLYPFQHPELAERFGIRAGGGVLLFGPPGTGKTMLAKATAGELDAAFFKVSPAEVLSKWVGEAEQNVKALFDAAADEPRAVIFIDEIEALVPARRDDGGTSVMQRVVPQILQGMEGFEKKAGHPVLFMGATNVPWQLDSAVLRPGRFDEKVYVPLPDDAARVKMLEIYLGNRPLADDVDLDRLASKLAGYSGADIKYIADRSAVIPFMRSVASGEPGEITAEVVEEVIAATPPSVRRDSLARFDEWAAAH